MRPFRQKLALGLAFGLALGVTVGLIFPIGLLAQELEDLLVPSGFLPGWERVGKPIYYTRENLFDYINGECELYFAYGFVKLVTAEYRFQGDEERAVVIDLYDMGAPLNAFGVYSNYTRPGLEYDSIGCEAIVSPMHIRFFQDRFKVQVSGSSLDSSVVAAVRAAAKEMARRLPSCRLPKELSYLPGEGMVPHSLKYVREGFLGQAIFPGGLEAQYEEGDPPIRGFVAWFGSALEASKALDRYVRTFKAAASELKIPGGKGFQLRDPRYGEVRVGAFDRFVWGVLGARDPDATDQLYQRIGRHLRSVPLSAPGGLPN